MKAHIRSGVVLALLAAGVVLFHWMYSHAEAYNLTLIGQNRYAVEDDAWIQRIVLMAAVILTLVPFTRRWIAMIFDFLRRPSATTRRRTAIAIAMLGGPLIYGLGAVRGRLGQPIWHDENMYRMQTTFLAHGKFCMPGLAHPDFFDTPYIFVRDVYAPVYFPGTALLHVPAAWMHLPYWLTPLLIAVVSLTLLYLIIAELIDGLAGLIAVVLMLSLHTFRWLALVEMSHAAGMMWGLVVLKSWLAWRRSPRIAWAILAGVAAGFYAITRPLDAICILLPVAAAWVWDLVRKGKGPGVKLRSRSSTESPSPYPSPLSTGEKGPERASASSGSTMPGADIPSAEPGVCLSRRAALATLLAAALCAAPLIAVQLAFDRAVTGHVLETPLARYNRVYFNARSLGLQTYDPAFRPPSLVPQIQKLYDDLDRVFIMAFTSPRDAAAQWFRVRLPLTLGSTTPTLFLVILLPVALMGLTDRRRWVLWSMFWCYLIGAGFFYIFSAQYTIAVAPALLFAVVLAVHVIQRTWPALTAATVFLPLGVLLLALEYVVMNQQNFFEPIPVDRMSLGWVSKYNYHWIPEHVQKPALVFFHFDQGERAWEEPVYNWDVVNPDDAPIIRVHDLGSKKNLELIAYYAKTQPDRHVYWFDRQSLRMIDLGSVARAMRTSTSRPAERPG